MNALMTSLTLGAGADRLHPDGPGGEGEVRRDAVAQPVHRHPQHTGGEDSRNEPGNGSPGEWKESRLG